MSTTSHPIVDHPSTDLLEDVYTLVGSDIIEMENVS
jgi:hypothetical protein